MPDYSSVVGSLKIVDPTKPLGTEIFNALARVTVSVAMEAVCLRRQLYIPEINSEVLSELQVYLVQRAPDDTAYPGE